MVFDKSVSDPANITISEDFDFLYRLITSGFYRVLCKSAMGGGEVFVCRLDDNDSNFYLDGSPADLTGTARIRLEAYTDAACDASDMDSSYGSRLAFHGTISELAPRQFKRLPVL